MWKQQSLKTLLKSSTDTTAPSPSSTHSDSDVDESGTPLESGDDLESTLSDGINIDATEPSTSEVLMKPHQLCIQFPQKKFGKTKIQYRSFNSRWFHDKRWSDWLHWKDNKIYCLFCRNIFLMKQLTLSKNMEASFIMDGFSNWKDATKAFE